MFQIFENQFQRLVETKTAAAITETTPLRAYTEPSVYKPAIVLFLIFFFQQLSGAYVIIFYAVDLFRKIGGHFQNGMDEYVSLVLLGTIRFVMSIISAFVSKKVGRRPLLCASGTGMCICSLVAGVHMYLTAVPQDALAKLNITKATEDDNIALVCVLGYVCLSSFGYLVIPWTLIGELLPVKVRGKVGGLMISVAYVMMFFMVKVFPFLLETMQIQFMFLVISVVNLVGVGFVFFFLPETHGKSFRDIEKYFQKSD